MKSVERWGLGMKTGIRVKVFIMCLCTMGAACVVGCAMEDGEEPGGYSRPWSGGIEPGLVEAHQESARLGSGVIQGELARLERAVALSKLETEWLERLVAGAPVTEEILREILREMERAEGELARLEVAEGLIKESFKANRAK
jgi:hypothetical protein